MRLVLGGVAICLALTACGPSAHEQAQRTLRLAKCYDASAYDQACSDANDLVYGQGQGAINLKLLVSKKRNQQWWAQPSLRVVPGGDVGAELDKNPSDDEKARRKAAQAKCKQGMTFDEECRAAFDAIFKPGAGEQQRKLLLQQSSENTK